MTDSEYVRELAKLAVALEANEISQHEWREQVAELRDRRIESWREQESKPQPPA